MSAFVVNIDCGPIPDVDPVVFIEQVITSISEQITQLDVEINMASQGDRGEVKALSEAVATIKSGADKTSAILRAILADRDKLEVAIARLEGPGRTLVQLKTLADLVRALEEEMKSDPEETFGYFAGVAELLVDVKTHLRPFEPYASTPQLKAVAAKVRGGGCEDKEKGGGGGVLAVFCSLCVRVFQGLTFAFNTPVLAPLLSLLAHTHTSYPPPGVQHNAGAGAHGAVARARDRPPGHDGRREGL